MPVRKLFSKRQRELRGELPDTYKYDEISNPLRVRIVHILRDAIGKDSYHNDKPSRIFAFIQEALCREYGKFKLVEDYTDGPEEDLLRFLLTAKDIENVIDVIELSFECINTVIRNDRQYPYDASVKLKPDNAIEELNERFREEGVGYSFENGEIIRVDSTYMHSKVTKPTISLLWNKTFSGASEEYMKAHEHYRHGRNKECLADCLKAFESTLKIICSEKKWPIEQTWTSKKLIQVCFENELIPSFTQNQFTSLRSLLESGIPTIRNKLGGHGQGQTPQKVDDEMTRYGLNLTGTNIIFLVEQSGLG